MYKIIKPPLLVKETGRKVVLKNTLHETLSQLEEGEKLCVLSLQRGGMVAQIITNILYFNTVQKDTLSFVGAYAVPESICNF